ncbi:MAG: 4'-phosphopantetheinyl transferase superfamily protein [Clostridia bacterium]|nr:4'-phosphopantetheinyl transferase superfamily protein [Clostridia bacterium]
MIRLILCDTGALPPDSAIEMANGIPEICGVLRNGKSEEYLRDSYASYLALHRLFPSLGLGALPCLLRDGMGKPYPEGSRYGISISHRSGVALIGISDGCEIGVDIERYTDKDISHLADRFIKDMRFKELKCTDVELYFAKLDQSADLENISKNCVNDKNNLQIAQIDSHRDGYSAWTALESVLKCEGCGFGGVSAIEELKEHISVMTLHLEFNGSAYAISLAKKQ